jgi:hypothetical protein
MASSYFLPQIPEENLVNTMALKVAQNLGLPITSNAGAITLSDIPFEGFGRITVEFRRMSDEPPNHMS